MASVIHLPTLLLFLTLSAVGLALQHHVLVNKSNHTLKKLTIQKNLSDKNVPWSLLSGVLFELGECRSCVTETPEDISIFYSKDIDAEAVLRQSCSLLDLNDIYSDLEWDEATLDDSFELIWEKVAREPGFETIRSKKGRLAVVPVQRDVEKMAGVAHIRLIEGQGWGNGEHPTTRMCLNFLEHVIRQGDRIIDYGTGSGVLSIAAHKLGAAHAIAVDIDEEILEHARINLVLNGCLKLTENGTVLTKLVHTRSVQPNSLPRANVVIANILVGPLLRLLPVLALAVQEGGLLCLSGFRERDRPVLREKYGAYIDWDDSLADIGMHEVWGEWGLIAGRPKLGLKNALKNEVEEMLSEMAVS